MAEASKSDLWQLLKSKGVRLSKPYVNYTKEELEHEYFEYAARSGDHPGPPEEPAPAPEPAFQSPILPPQPPVQPTPRQLPMRPPDEIAGLRLNTHPEDEPLRVDEDGLIWYQDEVRKPPFPKPRGRRILKYVDPGVKTVTLPGANGTSETFEMPGDKSVVSEAKITLPSYQVGIYKDPRLPFKIHIYNNVRGFDLFEVWNFYGGEDLVPIDIKRVYVENSLCYDIRSTIRAIQAEYRDRVLPKEQLV